MSRWEPSFIPKSGSQLEVIGICRISTTHQDPRSLADQEAYYRKWLKENVKIPWKLEIIASQGSGENLERAEYLELIDRTAEFDLVLTEDLGRICRRVHAHVFCENAVDVQTRVIAINDHVDTATDGWELSSYFAVMRHETYNKDTSKRIRRSLRNRFSQGGVVQCFPYGYIKPHPKAADEECSKDPDAEPIYKEWFRRLEADKNKEPQSYAEISDWLNAAGVPVGPYVRGDKWTSTLVAQVTHNPILKGVRCRNVRMSDRVNKSGRKKSIKAPVTELLTRHCENLAFFDEDYYDGVIAGLRLRNDKYRRGKEGRDCRRNVPRAQTRWPGQHLRCGICGRKFVFGGHGQTEHLMCDGARQHHCWNGITCDGPTTAQNVLEAIRKEVECLDGFDDEFRRLVMEETRAGLAGIVAEISSMERKVQALNRSIENFTQAIGLLGSSESLLNSLQTAETERADCRLRLQRLKKSQSQQLPKLPHANEWKSLVHEAFQDIDTSSPAFARLMRALVPEIHVYPFRLIDGGLPVLRARLTLNLVGFLPESSRFPGDMSVFQRELVVNLFNEPEREKYRVKVVTGMKEDNMTYKALAAQLKIKDYFVQQAGHLQKLMDSAGVTDPYQPIRTPIDGNRKYSRHRHSRYRFEPLPGYEVPNFPESDSE